MKTADLIPFILFELNECDKYGFELTKAIENKSNGKIVIKQPTLYTLLKKLEKSKFITSYWEDSEIGGKRHYYKLTENGRLQVSTMPSYQVLIKNAISEELESDNQDINENDVLNTTLATPKETIIPTEEIFHNENIDSMTEMDINIANSDILKSETISNEENFATNENVSKFTEKVNQVTQPISPNSISSNSSILDIDYTIPKNEIDIKYVDYVDFKNTDSYKKSKLLVKKLLWQVLSTSASLLFFALLSSLITSYTGRSWIYYVFFISSLVASIFYPIIYTVNMDKIRMKYETTEYLCNTKKKIYIGVTAFLLIIISCVAANISINKNTFSLIFSLKNFANFYAPLLMSSTYFLNVLYNHLFCSKLNK